MSAVVHMIVENTPRTVRMRCGKVVRDPVHSPGKLTDAEGNEFGCTVRTKRVTCKKCNSLLKEGTIHARTPTPPRNARATSARSKRAHARARPHA